MIDESARRFLTLEQVAEMFSTTPAQVYALVRRGELRAIKLGGRGQWRVGLADIDAFVERAYQETAEFVTTHPFAEAENRTRRVDQHPGDD